MHFIIFGKLIQPLSPDVLKDERKETFVFNINGITSNLVFYTSFDGNVLKIEEMRLLGGDSHQNNLEFIKFDISNRLDLEISINGSSPGVSSNATITVSDLNIAPFKIDDTITGIIPKLLPIREDNSIYELVFDISQSFVEAGKPSIAEQLSNGFTSLIHSWNNPKFKDETKEQFGFDHISYPSTTIKFKYLVIDFMNNFLEVRTAPENKYFLQINDSMSEVNKFSQHLVLKKVRLHRKNTNELNQFIETFSEPENASLFVHPEVFSSDADAPIFFQFALINGYLRHQINILRDFRRTPKTALQWVSLHDQLSGNKPQTEYSPFGLLMLKYLDSNSHPIALISVQNAEIALEYRHGWSNVPEKNDGKTIKGIVLDSDKSKKEYPLRVRTISYKSIDWDKRENYLFSYNLSEHNLTNKSLNSSCFWSKNGRVVLEEAPDEIFGVAKGSYLKKINPSSSDPVFVSLTSQSILEDNVPIYHKIFLTLKSEDWELKTQYEEKESCTSTDANSLVVAKRVYRSNTPIVIPAFDYIYGASNLMPRDAASPIPAILQKITDWVILLNEQVNKNLEYFSENESLPSVPVNHIKKHISGFERNTIRDEEKINTLFGYPLYIAETATIAAPITPVYHITEVKFKHGPLIEAHLAPESTAILKNNLLLQHFERLWNDIEFVDQWPVLATSEKSQLVKTINTLKKKIDALRNIFKNDIADATKALLDIKRLLEGNLDEVKGLGRRVQKIKAMILALNEEQLEVIWNALANVEHWQEIEKKLNRRISAEERRIINALLDYYYRPFAKDLLKELNKVITEEERKVIAEAIRITDAQFNDLLSGLEEEALEFVSDVLQGVDPVFKELQDLWFTLDHFKREYGPYLNIETYKRILKEASQEKLKELEGALRQKMLAEFKALLNQIKNWKEEQIAPYEEEIWNFIFVVGAIVKYHQKYQAYENILLEIKGCLTGDSTNKRINCLIEIYRSDVFASHRNLFESFLADLLFRHYHILQKNTQSFEDFIRQHEQEVETLMILALELEGILIKIKNFKEFTDCLNTIDNAAEKAVECFIAAYNKIQQEPERKALQLFIKELLLEQFGVFQENLVHSFEDFLRTQQETIYIILQIIVQYDKWKTFVEGLRNEHFQAKKVIDKIIEKDIGAVINYLGVRLGFSIRLADLRVDPPQYLAFGRNISFNVHPEKIEYYKKWLNRILNEQFKLCELGEGKSWSFNLGSDAIIILKLGNDLTAGDILAEVEESNRKNGIGPFGSTVSNKKALTDLISLLHPEISTKLWRGIIILNPMADIANDALLSDLCGLTQLKMIYTAIGGGRVKRGTVEALDIYARIKQERQVIEHPNADSAELQFTLTKFDATIKNTALEAGEIEFQLDIKELLGKKVENQKVFIKGTLPRQKESSPTRDFEFASWLPKPLEIELGFAFLDRLTTSSIKAARRNNETVLEIDANLKFVEFGEINTIGEEIILKNFRILIPKAMASIRMGMARLLSFDLPAIETVIKKPRSLNFFGVELTPAGVGIIKGDPQAFKNLTSNGFWISHSPGADLGANQYFIYLRLVVNFGKLPVLGGAGKDGLLLNGMLGFSFRKNTQELAGPFWMIYGVAGKGVVIDLLRFITLEAESLIAGKFRVNQTEATGLYLQNAKLKILNWPILGDEKATFNFLFLHSNYSKDRPEPPKNAFLAHLNYPDGIGASFFKIYWLLCAHNLTIHPQVLKALISPGESGQLSSLFSNDEIKIIDEKWDEAYSPGKTFELKNIDFTDQESWLFGGAFSIGGFLDACSIVLHDQHFYGIMLASSQDWFKAIFGTDKFSLAYIPGPRKELDRFRVEANLSGLNFFTNLKSGLIALELGINKDFLFDFGFPWRAGNTYLWHRTFSFTQGIYETRFGFYFEKRTEVSPVGDLLSFGAGVALSYGYRVAARSPFAWAEAGISITVILTGKVSFLLPEKAKSNDLSKVLYSIEVVGVIGIYAYAQGGINYFIITAEIRAEVVAAIAGRLLYIPNGNSTLTYAATLSVRYQASCTIKLGFIKKTFRISGSLDYGVEGRIALN